MVKFINVILIFAILLFVATCTNNQTPPTSQQDPSIGDQVSNYPFPNHTVYVGDYIKPNNYTQTELDNQTKTFYNEWKSEYLKNDCGNINEYYIQYSNESKTVSEAHGYGMLIMCYMAGHENNAKLYFDGMFKYYKSHPSNINHNLMDWQQITCNDVSSSADGSASDGDIDIAFSLLLAHAQWKSEGDINYLQEAKTIINAIMQDEINPNTSTVKLGDWSKSNNPSFYYGTRSSDFITSHFKSFSTATGNSNWNLTVDKCYDLVATVQNTTTGLVPDFIINTNTTAMPAGQNYLEGIYDGSYYYNACRFPWRISTDYLITGDNRAKTVITKLNTWLATSTSGNVNNISNGYNLDGTKIFTWNDVTFVGPFAVGAMTDINNQTWLNNLYENLISQNDLVDGDYYSNTIKLLSMITISGNYWAPDYSS
ncbi:glycosyl hydrolase family 8 [Flavivirga spongiicola]|uniref:Glucanase n=1 Tax=Flavivirga spongiicola TaxID=421621 RepID=A0ABU7XNV2_9FLAO|nr:glycosyl hydrolase family 8 [Flavivirga sp. MEBiC05379]MDO5981216.1 glycosyl hydrolase family 8 [Flavivirga sp. MEBiC05379]